MLSEVVRAFDGVDIETADAQGAASIVWVDPKYWPLARDRNRCVAHVEVAKIAGTGATVALVAEDSSGRIFKDIPLSNNTATAKGTFRVVIIDFAANLKLGIKITASGALGSATIGLEYTLKAF
jgi:hypothetical protein